MPAMPDAGLPGLRARLTRHLVDPLFRHGYTLIVNTALTSGLGMLYWILVGRLYSQADVARNAAVIASITFLANVAQLNLRPVLSRFVPVAGRGTARLVLLAYGSSAGVAVAAALLFLATSALWVTSGPVPGIAGDPVAAALFIGATAIWTVFALQDGVLIGFRATLSVTVENLVFSVAKIGLVVLFALATASLSFAITLSWVGPMIIAVGAVNLIVFGHLIPGRRTIEPAPDARVSVRRVVRFAGGDYVGALFAMTYIGLLPVIVVNQAGTVAAAQFYIVWVIVASFQLLPANMILSLVVDTAADPGSFERQGRRVLIAMARVLLPLCAALVVGAPLLLGLYGPSYEGATLLLRLLVLSVVPYAINLLYLGLARVRVTAARIVAVQAAIAVLILGLTFALVPAMGVDGVGVAFLAGHGLVATVLLLTVLRPLVLPRSDGAPLAR